MRAWLSLASFLGGIVLLTSACATSEEWSEWRGHTTHFASGTHGMFSMRNNRTARIRGWRARMSTRRARRTGGARPSR